MNAAAYRRVLDPIVRTEAFGHDRRVLLHLAVHLAVVVGLGLATALWASTLSWPLVIVMALAAGHSIGILAFAAHEIGHGAVMPPSRLRYWLELAGWTFALFTSVTIQRHAHNGAHHRHANTPRDPDRRYTVAEFAAHPLTGRMATWGFPNRRHRWFSAIVGFSSAIFTYHTALLGHSLARTGTRFDMGLPERLRRRALAEFVWNAGIYLALAALSGFNPKMLAFQWLAYVAATTLDGAYIATNHLLTGQLDEHDPLRQTVTVQVPAWIDFLHLRFSHHTEHHLYPNAGPAHYPAIRRALREHFPEQYQEMPWGRALRLLLDTPIAVLDAETLAECDGRDPLPVPCRPPAPVLSGVVIKR